MSATLVEKISDCINFYVAKAKQRWPEKLKDWDKPLWSLNLEGTTAGMAYYNSNKIRLNHALLLKNESGFFSETIPHEIAHLVSFRVFGKNGMGHGPEWKFVMRVFGLEAKRLHNFDVSGLKKQRTITRHLFSCNCNSITHELTTNEHTKITQKNYKFSCKICERELIPLNRIKTWVQ